MGESLSCYSDSQQRAFSPPECGPEIEAGSMHFDGCRLTKARGEVKHGAGGLSRSAGPSSSRLDGWDAIARSHGIMGAQPQRRKSHLLEPCPIGWRLQSGLTIRNGMSYVLARAAKNCSCLRILSSLSLCRVQSGFTCRCSSRENRRRCQAHGLALRLRRWLPEERYTRGVCGISP